MLWFHAFHFVELSPWPLLVSCGCFTLTIGCVMFFHCYYLGLLFLCFGFILIAGILILWFRDVIREALYQGHHTLNVQSLIKGGFALFIGSEIMFFVALFWAFFNCSLSPPLEYGGIWPGYCVDLICTWGVPWFNTLILLSSGATVTWCHHGALVGRHCCFISSLQCTIWLALIFTFWQAYEYQSSWLNISDGSAGSTFLLATGFHGLHVFIGTIFLSVSLYRQLLYHYSSSHLLGFEAAAWYFHFVDVVWLFLFLAIYWWGNLEGNLASIAREIRAKSQR